MSATAMKKTVKANINNPVFSYVDKGVYSAQLFGYEVLATRVAHNVWELRVTAGVDTGKLLGVAERRGKVLKEAYDNLLKQEAARLDWVLRDQPLRIYGKRGQYNTDIKLPQKSSEEFVKGDLLEEINEPSLTLVDKPPGEKGVEDDTSEPATEMTGKLKEFLTTEQKLRIKQFYKVRKDKLRGGFSLIMFDSKGIVEKVEGPFETAGETYERIMKLEGVEFPGE